MYTITIFEVPFKVETENPDAYLPKTGHVRTGWVTSIEQNLGGDFYSESNSSASTISLQIGHRGYFLGSLDGTKISPQIATTGFPSTYPSVTEPASA